MGGLEEHDFVHRIGGEERTTHYVAAGPKDGPLLVFVHGWPAIGKVWKPQLHAFGLLGFRAVAPDMPGYGGSTANKRMEDYAQEKINLGMVALLEHLGRDKAVWIGHDWGCGSVWTFAACYPDKCVAVCGMTVPYMFANLGADQLMESVDRELYPASEYPYGQWSYMVFYQTNFDRATAFFDADPTAVLRALYTKGSPEAVKRPAVTANVCKDGGWFGGTEKPNPGLRLIPSEHLSIDEETMTELVRAMQKTGFYPADAWYMNNARNRQYTLEKRRNDGVLTMPVLFVHAAYDPVCTSNKPKMSDEMRRNCKDLTECTIEAGHWVAEEKAEEVNAALAKWLVESVETYWPGKPLSKDKAVL